MAQLIINGNNFRGKNVIISNGKVIVDGKDVTPESKEINIEVQGDIDNLEVDVAKEIIVSGNVNKISNGSGDIKVKSSVNQNIKCGSGDVEVGGDVLGDIQTGSGDVDVDGFVQGSVKTGIGNIKHR